jgi:hypothetical protein
MGGGEEWKGKGVGVPEHVPAIARSGQTAGADRGLTGVGHRRHQVEQRDAGSQLQIVVTFDDDVGVVPAGSPSAAVLAQQPVEPGIGAASQPLDGDSRLR